MDNQTNKLNYIGWGRKLVSGLAYLLFLGLASLFLLELSYRYYWVDYYGSNLRALNQTVLSNTEERPNILVVGDSFSADQQGYVSHVRKQFPEYRVVNAAVPGTCVRQHQLLFKARLKEYPPDLVIYQVYVGNDLLEYRHPTTGSGMSWKRKVYWWLSDRIWVLGYINAKLPALRATLAPDQHLSYDAKTDDTFAVAHYSKRTKIIFRAEPHLLENSIELKGDRRGDMQQMTEDINKMLAEVPEEVPIVVLVLPHCVQMGEPYLSRMRQLGAEINLGASGSAGHFPFYDHLKSSLSNERTSVLNCLPWLLETQSTELYYPNDPHLTPNGHKVVADSLYAFLRNTITIH